MESPLCKLVILSRFVNKHGRHREFLFLIGQFLKTCMAAAAATNLGYVCIAAAA
jgi:hypothetical protein